MNPESKERVKAWLKDPYNLIFLAIILFAFGIRIYYFAQTYDQPLWWDESDYMAYAHNLAGMNSDWNATVQHNSLFSFLAAGLVVIGLSEGAIRFLLNTLPSFLLVILVYYIFTMLYKDKRIALIISFLTAVFWEALFNAFRFHVENLSMLLGFLAIYVFLKGYEKKEKIFGLASHWAIPLASVLVVLAYSLRRGYFFFGAFILLYMLATQSWKSILKDKYNWYGLGILIGLFLLVEKIIFISPIAQVAGTYYVKTAFNLVPFQIFDSYFKSIQGHFSALFYLFWAGFVLLLYNLAISFGHIRKEENWEIRADLFAFFTILIVLAYFLFYQKRADLFIGDPRWYYPLLFGAFLCIAKSTLFIADIAKKHHKYLGIAVILVLVGYGAYDQISHANAIITMKIPSYAGIRDISAYLKQVSSPADIAVSVPVPQAIYYSARKVLDPATLLNLTRNEEATFEAFLGKINSEPNLKFIIVSFSEPHHPDWMRKENQEYVQYPDGRIALAKWEIPFANSTIDFINQNQDIKQSITYGAITFQLIKVSQDTFLYQIIRS